MDVGSHHTPSHDVVRRASEPERWIRIGAVLQDSGPALTIRKRFGNNQAERERAGRAPRAKIQDARPKRPFEKRAVERHPHPPHQRNPARYQPKPIANATSSKGSNYRFSAHKTNRRSITEKSQSPTRPRYFKRLHPTPPPKPRRPAVRPTTPEHRASRLLPLPRRCYSDAVCSPDVVKGSGHIYVIYVNLDDAD